MKTVLRIFGIIVILISLLTCSMSIYRAHIDREELIAQQAELGEVKTKLAALKEEAKVMTGESKVQMDEEIATIENALQQVPSSSAYFAVEVLLLVLLVMALIFGFLLFRPNLKRSNQLFLVAVILTIIVFFVSPDIKRGAYSGLPSRTLALLSGIPVVIAGLFALLVAKRSVSK